LSISSNLCEILLLELKDWDYVIVGHSFVDGQDRNVWCDSKKPFTDLKMYQDDRHLTSAYFKTVPSNFKLYALNSVVKLIIDDASGIFTDLNTFANLFLCE
jgi:hypothetical protein